MATAEILHSDPDQSLATWNDILVLIWHVNTTKQGVDRLDSTCSAFAKTRPNGVALVTIVEENAPMPPAEARDAMATFLGRQSAVVKASAVIYEGSGFRAAAVRSVVAGLTLMARQTYPHKVFATVDEGITWLAPLLPVPASKADVVTMLTALRESIGQRRTAASA